MASELLRQWLLHYDPLHRGYTPAGIANGVCAARGFSFPRVAGGYNLYRAAAEDLGFLNGEIAGAAGANASAIETFPWRPAAADSTYRFALRAVGGGGVESALSDNVLVDFDSASEPGAPRPNGAIDLAVTAKAGGILELSWGYPPEDEELPPIEFHIFSDGGSGDIDLDSPVGAVAYVPRAGRFRFLTGPFTHGAAVRFAVRAVAAGGGIGRVDATATGVADAAAPAAPTLFIERSAA